MKKETSLPFSEESAASVAADFLLGNDTVKVWRSRGKIPAKYFGTHCPIQIKNKAGEIETRTLHCWRVRLNIHQSVIADTFGNTIMSVNSWEIGKRNPKVDDYDKLTKLIQSIYNSKPPVK